MTAARVIAAVGVAFVCGSAASATPAAAEVIGFTLGVGPEVELLSYAFSAHAPSFTVTALLGRSTELWFEDLTTGRDVSKAVLTATAGRTVPHVGFFRCCRGVGDREFGFGHADRYSDVRLPDHQRAHLDGPRALDMGDDAYRLCRRRVGGLSRFPNVRAVRGIA